MFPLLGFFRAFLIFKLFGLEINFLCLFLTLEKRGRFNSGIMNLQFISDSMGKTTGVYIPIKEWNDLKSKFKEIEQAEIDIPEWHKGIVRQRLADYKNNPEQVLDFDTAMDDIEKTL
jgi:hypothetical protein